jgi:ABC-type bacteriocin/lantibiotic exporter with double-glycine peptidase domain
MKKVLDIPNLRQVKNHCGPACLSMAARHAGYDYTQKEFAGYWGQEEVRREGVGSMVWCARTFGFIAHPRNNFTLEDIMRNINKGIPIIAFTIDITAIDRHYVLIKGYETNPAMIWFNDPDPDALDREVESWRQFRSSWRYGREGHRYGIIIRPRK